MFNQLGVNPLQNANISVAMSTSVGAGQSLFNGLGGGAVASAGGATAVANAGGAFASAGGPGGAFASAGNVGFAGPRPLF